MAKKKKKKKEKKNAPQAYEPASLCMKIKHPRSLSIPAKMSFSVYSRQNVICVNKLDLN